MDFAKNLVSKVKNLYSSEHLKTVAKETGFIKRDTKFTAAMFLEMLLFKVFDNGTVSLNDHSIHVAMANEIQMRKQSIDDRFNENSVKFVRALLQKHMCTQVDKNIDVKCLKNFTSVKIKDSTRFQIPDHLKEHYPGCGGMASQAGVHVQFEFDLLSGQINDLQVTDALKQDQTDAKQTVDMIEKGSLILRDLGYFSTDVLQQIGLKDAFYISRLAHKMKIYELKGESYKEICLKKVHTKMKCNGILYQEMDVYIGEKAKMPVRLIIEMMPQQEVDNRIAKAGKEARKKGRKLSEEYKTAAALNLFITNVPQQWLPTNQVRSLYRLRWQIELRFKSWKSFCRLHACKKMKLHRFETYLYACLLFILINWEISVGLLSVAWQSRGKLISILKCYKAIIQSAAMLNEALFDRGKKLTNYLQLLYQTTFKQLLLEKRKGRLSQQEILLFEFEIKTAIC